MSTDIINRRRNVDVNKLNDEQIQLVIDELSKKVNLYVDEAIQKANQVLNIYNLEAKMEIAIVEKLKTQ